MTNCEANNGANCKNNNDTNFETNNENSTPIDIKPTSKGKVRNLYDLGDALLFVATDRISAYDYVLKSEIPNKGKVLTKLSLYWFEVTENIVPNHLISTDVRDLPEKFAPYANYLKDRFMLVKKAEMFPVECIVRGYLVGSGYAEYKQTGSVCGTKLPAGLHSASKLDTPLFTPSTKAEIGEHDENISFGACANLIGESDANALRNLSTKIYSTASRLASERGIIIADTKFEFGKIGDEIVLADEVLTPDSSRFWPADKYEVGASMPSFDKQFVRDWLCENWDKNSGTEPPELPSEIIEKTSEKYIQAYEIITGRKFE